MEDYNNPEHVNMKFLNRSTELAWLDATLRRMHPTQASLELVYGRRRIGKTVLLQHWAARTGLPFTYVLFDKDPPALQRRKVAAQALGVDLSQAPLFESWSELWAWLGRTWLPSHRILILDEITYAANADPAMVSSLQHAWDNLFKRTNIAIYLCGSHVQALESLLSAGSPLFGRFTGNWHVRPFAFGVLKQAFPKWSAEERVAAYAMVGGVPAYLEWLRPDLPLVDNIQQVVLNPGGMFMAEPMFLLYDELGTVSTYLAIIKSIGNGRHAFDEISNDALVSKTHLTAYLRRLQELRMVERRLPVTVNPRRVRVTRRGRYHLSDAYFRFYFEFLAPRQGEYELPEVRLERIRAGLRAFVGRTAYEQLALEWTSRQNLAGRLPFKLTDVGQHWSRRTQVDVVGVNWVERQLLVGECKWTEDRMDRAIVMELAEHKTPLLLRDLADDGEAKPESWDIRYVFFARRGFTPAALAEMKSLRAIGVDLSRLDKDLTEE